MRPTATLARSFLLLALLGHALRLPVYGDEKNLARFLLSNSTISESRLPLYMAKDLGLFEKYGLDADNVHIRGAGVNIAALMAGEIQMAVAAGNLAIIAAARGAPIVIVGTTGPTRYDLVSAVLASPRELKGKIIG